MLLSAPSGLMIPAKNLMYRPRPMALRGTAGVWLAPRYQLISLTLKVFGKIEQEAVAFMAS
jgi:hypothetical protein